LAEVNGAVVAPVEVLSTPTVERALASEHGVGGGIETLKLIIPGVA
jgi:hypothetical protein